MSTMPIRLDRIEAGLVAWVRQALPAATVLWAPSEYPRARARKTLVTLKILAGPDEDPRGGSSRTHIHLPMSATVRVVSAPAGQSFIVRVSGRQWGYTIPGGATPTTVRDALLAQILDVGGVGPLTSCTFAAAGADTIEIDALEPGDLYGLGHTEITPGTILEVLRTTQTMCEVSTGDVTAGIEVMAFSSEKAGRLGAGAAIAALRAHVKLGPALELLDAYGLSVVGAPGRTVNLDGLSGPTWESRAAWRPTIATTQVAAVAISRIERVRATLDVRQPGSPTGDIVTIEVPDP